MPVTEVLCFVHLKPMSNLSPYPISAIKPTSFGFGFCTISPNFGVSLRFSSNFCGAKDQFLNPNFGFSNGKRRLCSWVIRASKDPGAEEKLEEISAAYEVLSDDEKRSLYDRFGESGLPGEYDGSGFGSEGMDPFEIYNAFFGNSDGFFGGQGAAGGINFNLGNMGNQDLDIR
ncbi:hypothetical protein P3X46_032089 [Hevea brasiliensis]|uniref:J domain-containing protein n=1 Tax=Hevea brasiliensis TaxID=3981 RepID=A0ABQ9KMF7_HEVBR|nr:hypothetical protein P3X46_032089 [Hevea brasiliensis]